VSPVSPRLRGATGFWLWLRYDVSSVVEILTFAFSASPRLRVSVVRLGAIGFLVVAPLRRVYYDFPALSV